MKSDDLLTIIILTYNEDMHIERAIRSARSVTSKIFVVDSYSTDQTTSKLDALGVKYVQRPFSNQADQFQWGLDNLAIKSEWVMRLDADEIIEVDLAENIRATLPDLPPEIQGINLKRKHIFLGKWVRFGGRYPLTMLRIWRTGSAKVEQRWMDEHIYLTSGRAITLDGGFSDHNLNDLSFFTDKHNKYATREAVDVINRKRALFGVSTISISKTSFKAGTTRFLKERFYNKIPFQLSALGYFLYRYILQLGFLDGREGAIYHVLQGFWYRYLVGAKVFELETAIDGLDNEAALAELVRLTGLRLSG